MNKNRGQKIYSLKERLERLSKRNKKTGCIEWISSTRNGYGRLVIGSRTDKTRKSVDAHRLSYEIHKGQIPEGMLVCHTCDNRSCINPDHLWIGTYKDNALDMVIKGRHSNGRIPKFNEEG